MAKTYGTDRSMRILDKFRDYWQWGSPADFEPGEFHFLIDFFQENDEPDKVARVFDLAIDRYPSDHSLLEAKARWLLTGAGAGEALAILDYLSRERPEDADILALRLQAACRIQDADRITGSLRDILNNISPLPAGFSAWLMETVAGVHLPDFGLEKWLQRIFAQSVSAPETQAAYLNALGQHGMLKRKHLSLFYRLRESGYDEPEFLMLFVRQLLRFKRDPETAREMLFDLRGYDGTKVQVWLQLAELYEQTGSCRNALLSYGRVLQLQDPSASIYFRMSRCSRSLADLSGAERFLRLALNEDPAYIPAWLEWADLYARRREWERALHILNEAASQIPNRRIYEKTGEIHLQTGNHAAALAVWEKAYRLGSRSRDFLTALQELYHRLGLAAEATRLQAEIRSLFPAVSSKNRL